MPPLHMSWSQAPMLYSSVMYQHQAGASRYQLAHQRTSGIVHLNIFLSIFLILKLQGWNTLALQGTFLIYKSAGMCLLNSMLGACLERVLWLVFFLKMTFLKWYYDPILASLFYLFLCPSWLISGSALFLYQNFLPTDRVEDVNDNVMLGYISLK